MARRILIFILVSPVFALYLQEEVPSLRAGPAPIRVSVDTAGEGDGGFLCGECLGPGPEYDGGRHPAAVSTTILERGPGAGRRGPVSSPGHGLGAVLSSLSDSLFLSRPPPAVSGRS